MNRRLKEIYASVRSGRLGEKEFERALNDLFVSKLGRISVDGLREGRTGIPEVIYGRGKAYSDLESAVSRHVELWGRALVTKVDPEDGKRLKERFPDGIFNERASTFRVGKGSSIPGVYTALVSAGASDAPVLEEAEEALIFLGSDYRKIEDVGVAGPHRVLEHLDTLRGATSIIVFCGMEAALASYIASLVDRVVIGVPVDSGYGVCFGGVAPLLAMLNSCSPGVCVVNISNGFGAACIAHKINLLFYKG